MKSLLTIKENELKELKNKRIILTEKIDKLSSEIIKIKEFDKNQLKMF